MSGKLEVSFNSPQCGWMSIGFSDGRSEFHTTTAHAPHAAALPELMTILGNMLGADSGKSEHRLKWNRDPEEFDLCFVRDGEKLDLEIYQYPDERRQADECELVFSHSGTVHGVCKAFAATFDQLHADQETDEFEFNWHQPFPDAEYRKFKKRID